VAVPEFWVSWDNINTMRAAYPGSTIAEDTELRRVIALPGGIRVTYDHQGVLITVQGVTRKSMAVGTSPEAILVALAQISVV
jgi:hypothetical protein